MDFTIQSLYTQKDRGYPAGAGHCTMARHKSPPFPPHSNLCSSFTCIYKTAVLIYLYIDIYTTFTKKESDKNLTAIDKSSRWAENHPVDACLFTAKQPPLQQVPDVRGFRGGGGRRGWWWRNSNSCSARLDSGLAMCVWGGWVGEMKWEGNSFASWVPCLQKWTAFQKEFQKGDWCSCMEF